MRNAHKWIRKPVPIALTASPPMRPFFSMNLIRFLTVLALLTTAFLPPANAWTPNAQEIDIANRMKSASGQGRPSLKFDPILSQVARERAMDLAKRRYFSHTNPDGHGVNYLVRKAGYVLPDWYPSDGNNLESIAAGRATSGTTWSDWMGSPDHKRHLLAEEDFFVEQTAYGVGYYEEAGTPYRYYWVVLTAPPMPQVATVDIVSPTEGAFVPEGAVNVAGTSDGSEPAALVQISVENANGNSGWSAATGTQTWTATLRNLPPGANTLRVRSLSSGGDVLAESSRTFQYLVVRLLRINVVGQGSVGDFTGATQRRVGGVYKVTATPAAGWLFAGWSGGWSGTQPTVDVTMRAGLEATATFVPNPFIARRGSYTGIVASAGASPVPGRVLRLNVNGFGKVTGVLVIGANRYPILAEFRLDGRAVIRLPRANAETLLLVVDMNGASANLTASLVDRGTTTTFAVAPAVQTVSAGN